MAFSSNSNDLADIIDKHRPERSQDSDLPAWIQAHVGKTPVKVLMATSDDSGDATAPDITAVDQNMMRSSTQAKVPEVLQAYNGSKLVFKALRAVGWGPLLNLGYYSYLTPWNWLDIPAAQTRLVRQAMALGCLQPGQHVLDVACGRGKSSYMMSCEVGPNGSVLGVDLLPQNISTASWLYVGDNSNGSNLSYVEGNAHALDCHPDIAALSPDVIFCIEAAFHFDRPAFLQSAARVLKPGGRVVVVDFMWHEAAAAGKMDAEAVEATRDVWQFKDFSTEGEYRQMAEQAGLVVKTAFDWTSNVLGANSLILRTTTALARREAGRAALRVVFPELQLSQDEWAECLRATAHQVACLKHVRYVALLLEHAA